MASNPDLKVVTGKVRLSFAHVFEPYSPDPDQEPKYSAMLLIPKTDKVTLGKLRKAQQAALEQGKSSKFGGSIPKVWKNRPTPASAPGALPGCPVRSAGR